MSRGINFQPIPVLIDGFDTEGQRVLAEGELCAVLTRLDGDAHDPEMKGWWHLEAALDTAPSRVPTSSRLWTRQRLGCRLVSRPANPSATPSSRLVSA